MKKKVRECYVCGKPIPRGKQCGTLNLYRLVSRLTPTMKVGGESSKTLASYPLCPSCLERVEDMVTVRLDQMKVKYEGD